MATQHKRGSDHRILLSSVVVVKVELMEMRHPQETSDSRINQMYVRKLWSLASLWPFHLGAKVNPREPGA